MKRRGVARAIGAGEFKAKCLELMDQVASTGDVVVITKRGRPVAQLGPVVERPATLFGFLRGSFTYVGDVVSPIDVVWEAAASTPKPRRSRRRSA